MVHQLVYIGYILYYNILYNNMCLHSARCVRTKRKTRERRPAVEMGWRVQQQRCAGVVVVEVEGLLLQQGGGGAPLKAPRKEKSVINYLRVAYRMRSSPRVSATLYTRIISCRRCCSASEGMTAAVYIYILYDIILHQSASSPTVVGGWRRRYIIIKRKMQRQRNPTHRR